MCLHSLFYEMLHRTSLQFTRAFIVANVQTHKNTHERVAYAAPVTLLKLKPSGKEDYCEMVEEKPELLSFAE